MRFFASKVSAVLPHIILLIALFFLFTPATIYIGNAHEFTASLMSILWILSLPAVCLFLFLLIVAVLIPPKKLWIYELSTFLLGVLFWIQANYLVWNYGSFNGRQIDWSKNEIFGYLELFIWVAVFVVGFLFKDTVLRSSRKISFAILGIQLVTVLFSATTSLGGSDQKLVAEQPTDQAYSFAKKGNVIHIVLDSVQSDILQEIFDEGDGSYARQFDGFTFYKNATSSFSATQMSVPSFMTNHVYENKTTMKDFLDEVFNGKNLVNILSEHGFVTDVFHGAYPFPRGKASSYQLISNPYQGINSQNFDGLKIFNFALFRLLPHSLKKKVYNDQNWRFYDLFENVENRKEFFIFNNFLLDLSKKMYVGNDRPTYKYIHSLATHMPIETDRDCKYVGVQPTNRENAKNLFRCGLSGVFALFDSLKKNGIYEDSIIILHSDHGFGVTVEGMQGMTEKGNESFHGRTVDEEYHGDIVQGVLAGRANPFVMIKPSASRGVLKYSQAPIELLDISPTILDLLRINESVQGTSVFKIKEDADRRRLFKYFFDSSKPYLGQLDEYIIEGDVRNRASWKLGRKLGSE